MTFDYFKLLMKIEKFEDKYFWPDDNWPDEDWKFPTHWWEKLAAPIYCRIQGHEITLDQCGIPEHAYCIRCRRV